MVSWERFLVTVLVTFSPKTGHVSGFRGPYGRARGTQPDEINTLRLRVVFPSHERPLTSGAYSASLRRSSAIELHEGIRVIIIH